MDSSNTTLYFRNLLYLAIFLLWGISLVNGTIQALMLAVWNGRFGTAGIALKTDYTGIPLVDYPIALLVAFFFYGTNGYDEGYQLFLFDAYSTLQSAFVWLYVEMLRPGHKSKWINRPVVFGILWQCFGAAIALPLYYSLHLEWFGQAKTARAVDLDRVRSLPLAFILGAIVPWLVGMAPTWLGPDIRAPETHQTILAAWQPDPLWVSGIMAAAVSAGTRLLGRSAGGPNDKAKERRWVRISYLLAAVSSALGHLYVAGRIFSSNSEAVSLVRMYVPFPFAGPAGMEDNIFVKGPWLFLQYDLIIISLSSLSWAFLLLKDTPLCRRLSAGMLALALTAGSLTVGTGATVTLALLAREEQLPQDCKE